MNNINFRIIETEEKILEIINNCDLPIIVLSMLINNIKDSIDYKKISVIDNYKKKVIENVNNTDN